MQALTAHRVLGYKTRGWPSCASVPIELQKQREDHVHCQGSVRIPVINAPPPLPLHLLPPFYAASSGSSPTACSTSPDARFSGVPKWPGIWAVGPRAGLPGCLKVPLAGGRGGAVCYLLTISLTGDVLCLRGGQSPLGRLVTENH